MTKSPKRALFLSMYIANEMLAKNKKARTSFREMRLSQHLNESFRLLNSIGL